MIHEKNPLLTPAGGGTCNTVKHISPQRKSQSFLPPRFRFTLPPLHDPRDIELAISIRGALRRAINRGTPIVAEQFASLAAKLVRRRANGGGE